MRSFTFHPGPRILAGPDQAQALAEKLPPGPCLFVTDRDVLRLGLTDTYREAIAASGCEVIVFDAVEADPSNETLLAAVAAGSDVGSASVVGFGGGSPMDVAKLAAYLLGSGDELDKIWGVDVAKGQRLPLILVPTTAGTGSEASPISVITCEGGVKLAVNARPLTADWAVLDASLTLGLPAHVVVGGVGRAHPLGLEQPAGEDALLRLGDVVHHARGDRDRQRQPGPVVPGPAHD